MYVMYMYMEREWVCGGVYIFHSFIHFLPFNILRKPLNCKLPEESGHVFNPLYLTKNLPHTQYIVNTHLLLRISLIRQKRAMWRFFLKAQVIFESWLQCLITVCLWVSYFTSLRLLLCKMVLWSEITYECMYSLTHVILHVNLHS